MRLLNVISSPTENTALNKVFLQCAAAYVGPSGGHEDSEMCEVVAGARGCGAVDVDSLTAISGPVALQGGRLILPKGTLGHISCSVYRLWGIGNEKDAVIFLYGTHNATPAEGPKLIMLLSKLHHPKAEGKLYFKVFAKISAKPLLTFTLSFSRHKVLKMAPLQYS